MPIAHLDVPEGIENRGEEDIKTVRFERRGAIGRIVLANPQPP
jgi:hypothetical protein